MIRTKLNNHMEKKFSVCAACLSVIYTQSPVRSLEAAEMIFSCSLFVSLRSSSSVKAMILGCLTDDSVDSVCLQ